jgi:hypothetical protein
METIQRLLHCRLTGAAEAELKRRLGGAVHVEYSRPIACKRLLCFQPFYKPIK